MYPLNARGGWVIPPNTEVPGGTEIPPWSEIGHSCTLGDGCTLGRRCLLGYSCTLGNYCTLGDSCTLGHDCTLGGDCLIGYGCHIPRPTWNGTKVSRWLTLANVDGTGHMVLILQDEQGEVWIETGCFFGPLDNFIARAQSEGKHVYVAVVSAVVKSLEDLHHENTQ